MLKGKIILIQQIFYVVLKKNPKRRNFFLHIFFSDSQAIALTR